VRRAGAWAAEGRDVAVKPSHLRAALKHARHRVAVLSCKVWDPDDRSGPPINVIIQRWAGR